MQYVRSCLRADFLLIVVFMLVFAAPVCSEDAIISKFLQPGAKAPVSTLEGLDENRLEFPVKGSWNLVFFWSLFCQSCLEKIPIMAKELSKPEYQGVKSFYVSLDTARMKKGIGNYFEKRGFDETALLEEIENDGYKTADKWGVKVSPSTFLVGPDGTIAFSSEGPFEHDLLFSLLREKLSENKEVAE